MIKTIKNHFLEAEEVLKNFNANPQNFELILKAGEILSNAIKAGGKIISCGNGGSMCDAMHFAEELSGRYRDNRKALAAIAGLI